jgi:probable LLM family oxidoreductase
MEFGIYSFGDVGTDPASGERTSPAQAITDLLERIRLAEQVGLDYFGIGEHHRAEYAVSSPSTILAAAAAVTSKIRLGSAVTVLSTEDPVRVYQQFASIDLISGGRAELVAGRGSFIESFPLFGADLSDYDALFAEKLDLLLQIDRSERVTWSGRFRPALQDAEILPRPANGSLDIWIATGGNPESSARAGELGLPVSYAIIGGHPARFAPLFELYRRSAARTGHDPAQLKTAVAGPGFIGSDSRHAKDTFYPYWIENMRKISAERGFSIPTRDTYDELTSPGGAIFAGSPNEVADRMLEMHTVLGNDRHGLQMDWSGVPHELVMRSIELFGTEVAPQINDELAGRNR